MMARLDAGPLCLRPLEAADEELYGALYGDAGTMAHIAPVPGAEALARSFQATLLRNRRFPQQGGYWVMCASDGGVPLGLAGLNFDDLGGAEVGVVLPAAHQGRGYATHAIAALADHAFIALGRVRLYTRHDAGHAQAAGLMQALGFQRTRADPGRKGWRWELTSGRWAAWPRRQAAALGLRSLALPHGGNQPP